MTNILVGIKRFFKNKNTVTILAVILCVGILYFGWNNQIKKATDPVSYPYATKEIGSRTLITADMVSTRKVPGGVVGNGSPIRNTNDIIGKYVVANTIIPKGSLFYSSAITDDWEEAKSSLYEDISDNNTLVSLSVSLESTYGNSIYPGNYIDLYYVGIKDGKLYLGKFIESIMVLGVIDGEGNNVFEKSADDTNSPAYLVFSVPEDYYLLLQKTNYLAGSVFPVPRNASYSENPSATRIASTDLANYITNQTKDVASLDEEAQKNNGIGTISSDVVISNETGSDTNE